MADKDRTSGRRDVRNADESEDFSSGRRQQTVIPPAAKPRQKPGEQPTTQEGEGEGEGGNPGVPVGPGKGP